MKNEIIKKKRLKGVDHYGLIDYCRAKCDLILTQDLVDVEKKNLSREFNIRRGGRLHSVTEPDEAASPTSEMQQMQQAITRLTELVAAQQNETQPVSAVRPPPSPTGPRREPRATRRTERRGRSPGASPGRSGSPSRFFLEGWGKRCNHCGSDKHLKRDCKEFHDMMAKANVGIPKDKWKPPEGYKSALGRARDAARKRAQKVSAIVADADDTASESDLSDSDSVNFSIRAMKPVKKGTPFEAAHIKAVTHAVDKGQYPVSNRFDVFNNDIDLKQDNLDSLGSWAKVVTREPQSIRKLRKKMVVIKDVKDIQKLEGQMAAMTLDNGGLSRTVQQALKNMRIECENDEVLAMIDSGSTSWIINWSRSVGSVTIGPASTSTGPSSVLTRWLAAAPSRPW